MILGNIFIFVLGLTVGSFLNAVIYRLSQGDSAMRGRSYCPHCKHTLAWYDLIPVVSFVLLGGKCRYCKRGISVQYPLMEVATAALFLLSFNAQGSSLKQVLSIETLSVLYLWTIASLLIVLFVYDVKHYILPDKILLPAIGVVLAYRIFEFFRLGPVWDFEVLFNPFLSAFGAALFFFSIFALSKGRAMGFGDVKLALFMGLFLGWPNILVALFVAFLTGGIIGILLIAARKKGLKSEIPFGPFLIAGTFIALFWGDITVEWYKGLIGL